MVSKEEAAEQPVKLSLRQVPTAVDVSAWKNVSELDLTRAGLSVLPEFLFDASSSSSLPATLTRLEVSFNKLQSLPDTISSCSKLRVLFAMGNLFDEIPEVLSKLPSLGMLSFKSNKIVRFSETCLPETVYWLILTDNQIPALPKSIGKLTKLRKFMMASNRLTGLPDEIVNCTEIELIRLSDNSFTQVPEVLFKLPKLTWVALGGNFIPPAPKVDAPDVLEHLVSTLPPSLIAQRSEIITSDDLLGEGTSGKIYAGTWHTQPCAVKVFKNSATTSDGRPVDEAAVWCHLGETETVNSTNVVRTLGVYLEGKGEGAQLGVIMERLPAVTALGLTPSFASVSRDVYELASVFPLPRQSYAQDFHAILHLCRGFASAVAEFHSGGVIHGDLYAHNLLVTKEMDKSRIVKMGDLGGAFFLPPDAGVADKLKRVEVRALGVFIDEMLECLGKRWQDGVIDSKFDGARGKLEALRDRLMGPLADRLLGPEAVKEIDTIAGLT